jgi:hypothetical protein
MDNVHINLKQKEEVKRRSELHFRISDVVSDELLRTTNRTNTQFSILKTQYF